MYEIENNILGDKENELESIPLRRSDYADVSHIIEPLLIVNSTRDAKLEIDKLFNQTEQAIFTDRKKNGIQFSINIFSFFKSIHYFSESSMRLNFFKPQNYKV